MTSKVTKGSLPSYSTIGTRSLSNVTSDIFYQVTTSDKETLVGSTSESICPPTGSRLSLSQSRRIFCAWLRIGFRIVVAGGSNIKRGLVKLTTKGTYKLAILSHLNRTWCIELAVHLAAILAVVVIAVINLKGLFIGTQFVGVHDGTSQSIALFSLQVTAKLLEIAAVASLGFIVLGAIQHFLLFDESGLPVGLIDCRLTFPSLFHLLTPSFWISVTAFRSWKSRFGVGVLLTSCVLLATFIGPASALLLIPNYQYYWPAGGVTLVLPINKTDLWPDRLTISNTDPSRCTNPVSLNIMQPGANNINCLWFDIDTLNAINIPLPDHGNLTIPDGGGNRRISWATFPQNSSNQAPAFEQETWFWTSMSTVSMLTNEVSAWWTASINAVPTNDPFGTYSRFSSRDQSGSQQILTGALSPATRVRCIKTEDTFNGTTILSYPAIPYSSSGNQAGVYLIPTTINHDPTSIRAYWVDPLEATLHTENGTTIEDDLETKPSAFLVLQCPFTVSNTSLQTVTCSIDARWISGGNLVSQGFDDISDFGAYQMIGATTVFNKSPFDSNGYPLENAVSPPVQLDLSWLNQLTPAFNVTDPASNYTQLSQGWNLLSEIFNSSYTPWVIEPDIDIPEPDLILAMETMIPLMVVDGMARNSLQYFNDVSDIPLLEAIDATGLNKVYQAQPNQSSTSQYILDGSGLRATPANQSAVEVLSTFSIAGYGYRAGSTGTILALVVILAYVFLAVGQIGFTIYRRWYSTVWSSGIDMLALAQQSPASDLMNGAAESKSSHSLRSITVRLRVADQDNGIGDEKLHVLVHDKAQSKPFSGYRMVKKGNDHV